MVHLVREPKRCGECPGAARVDQASGGVGVELSQLRGPVVPPARHAVRACGAGVAGPSRRVTGGWQRAGPWPVDL